MARDSIQILRTVRRRSVEEARHALGVCLTAEAQAADKVQAIDDAAQGDRAAHQTVAEAHLFLEMFVRRLHLSEAQRRSAEAALTAARALSAEARAAVVAARTAAEAVETLIAERAAADEADANRREQHALDDIARTRLGPGNRPAASGAR
jgi:flagellar biosynthesis chaperone FliJ